MKSKLIWMFLLVLGLFSCNTDNDPMGYNGYDDEEDVQFTTSKTQAPTPGVGEEVLAQNSTVRILVYRRAGPAANLSADLFVKENTYHVEDVDGSLLPCTVDPSGKYTGEGTAMGLAQGTYDIYAVTPALPVSRNGGTAVSVGHGVDYATSMTGNVEVKVSTGGVNQVVPLSSLQRKCSKLSFSFDRQYVPPHAINISSVIIDEVTLGGMSNGPLTVPLVQDLPAAATQKAIVTLGQSIFTTHTVDKYKATGSTVVLPKAAGDFTIAVKVYFNGSAHRLVLDPYTIKNYAFEKGKQYNFSIKLQGVKVILVLTVSDWLATHNVDADNLGGANSIILEMGNWTEEITNDSDFDHTLTKSTFLKQTYNQSKK